MKKLFNDNKRFASICIITVISLCALILFYEIASNAKVFFAGLGDFFSYLSRIFGPVIYGMVIAYLLHRSCNAMCRLLAGTKVCSKMKNKGRSLGIILTFIIAIAVFVLFIYALIPNTIESITSLFNQLMELREPAQKWLANLEKNKFVKDTAEMFNFDINKLSDPEFYADLLAKGQKILESISSSLFSIAVDTGKFFYNLVLGFVIAIYINLDWPSLKHQSTRLLKAMFPQKYERIKYVCLLSDNTFSRYMIGKLISSSALGAMCIVLCLIFRIKYAALIGLIVAVTNLVPIFGPWVGTILCALFAFLSGFKQAIVVVIIILVVQQLENNIVQPRVLGSIVNLSGFWVFVSIILAGSVGGVMAMLIAIPVFSIMKVLIGEWIAGKIKRDSEKAEAADAEN